MFTRPDEKQIQALSRLVKTTDGEALLAVLDAELDRLFLMALDSSGEQAVKLLAMARTTKDLIQLLRQSPELANKAR